MNEFAQALLASVLAGFVSMVVAFFGTARLSQKFLERLVSFAAGLMLALALLDLLPEAIEGGLEPKTVFSIMLVALIALFALDHRLHAHHTHVPAQVDEALARPIPMVLVGGALHVFSDGLLLGACFLSNTVLAWGMAFAILAHEIPREAGDFALLLSARWPRSKALTWNAISRLACVLGAVIGFFALSHLEALIPYVLTVAAANFIYIALCSILPWLRQKQDSFAWQGGFMMIGAALVPISLRFLH